MSIKTFIDKCDNDLWNVIDPSADIVYISSYNYWLIIAITFYN